MKLTSFRVKNFRSVNDGGSINVSKVTTLVGRNESGKTNLLLGLHSLNPPGGPKELSAIKDFPRHRRMSECTPDTPVVETAWELDGKEQAILAKMFPRATGVTKVTIGRHYKATSRWVGFVNLKPLDVNHAGLTKQLESFRGAVSRTAESLESGPKGQLNAAFSKVEQAVSPQWDVAAWAAAARPPWPRFGDRRPALRLWPSRARSC